MTHELKPCPFCGGPAAEPDENNHTSCTTISCGSTAYMSAPAWNERPAERAKADDENIRSALKDVRGSIKNARGAVESNQVADKDVHGTLSRAIRMIDAALQDSPPIIRVEGDEQ